MTAKKQATESKVAEAETAQLCRLFNLTSARVGQLAKDGIIFKTGRNKYDLWRSIRGYIEFLQKSKYAASGDDAKSGITDAQAIELEGLIEQVKSARTYNDARTLKLQIEALRSGFALEVDQMKHVSKSTVEEALMKIGAAVRSAIVRMEADLPPMLDGASPATMQRIIREKTDEVMTSLADAANEVWTDEEEEEK